MSVNLPVEMSTLTCKTIMEIVKERNDVLINEHASMLVIIPTTNQSGRVTGYRYSPTQPDAVHELRKRITELEYILDMFGACGE